MTVDNPIDITSRMQNPDFTLDVKGDNGGWTKEGTAKTFEINSWVPATVEGVMTSPALNLWGSNQDIYVWQDVEGIPNGIYEFSAGVYSQANGPYLHANGAKAAVTTGGPSAYRVLAYVTDHVIRIGVGFPAEGTQWVMADCFRLKYFGNSLQAYKMWIDETLSSDASYEEKACYSPLKEAYVESLEILKGATAADELMAELPHFTELYDSIKTCIAAYDDFQELLAKAKQMILDGAYAGDDFYVLADYVDFDIEPDEIFPNGNAAYILQNGTLTAEQIQQEKAFMNQLIQNVLDNCMGRGADATAKLSNANFDGGLSGWVYDKKLGTPSPGGMSVNPNVERWNQNFDFYQEVELPNGVYQLNAQAFYRTAANTVAEQEWLNGEAQVLTSLYANTGEVLIKNVYEEAQEEGFYKEDNAYRLEDGRVVPNSMKTASEAFSAGLYENVVKGVVWNGRLRLGVRSLNASAADRWSIWDNFRLTYLGMEAEPIAECYDKTIAEAEEMLSDPEISDEQKADLSVAAAAVVDKTDAAATLETIANIRKAMDAVNATITGIGIPPVAPDSLTNTPSYSIYSLNGTKHDKLHKGLNIVRMSNGQVRKVLVK